MSNTTALVREAVPAVRTAPPQQSGTDIFATPEIFEHAQRVAKVFSSSALVPDHLKKSPADALIAYGIARRLGEDPLVVMQNIYFVSGKPGWSVKYKIARANKAGVFKKQIKWDVKGEGEQLVVRAFATLSDGEEVSAEVSMKMAKAEGWTKNSKYTTMPVHMLKWRSASMLIDLSAPEVMLGLPTVYEEPAYEMKAQDDGTLAAAPVTGGKKKMRAAEILEGDFEKPAELAEPAEDHDPATGEVIDAETVEDEAGM
jgi:hypothetical protein